MSCVSKKIRPWWCTRHANEENDGDDRCYDYTLMDRLEGDDDDDDDDGDYDIAPAA